MFNGEKVLSFGMVIGYVFLAMILFSIIIAQSTFVSVVVTYGALYHVVIPASGLIMVIFTAVVTTAAVPRRSSVGMTPGRSVVAVIVVLARGSPPTAVVPEGWGVAGRSSVTFRSTGWV